LYDTYIKAFRWSTDRLDPENGGIICFVSNGSWIDGNAQAGFRSHLEKEFSSIYVFNLRGNQRTSGELSRKEGGKIFGSGSRTPISITLLVKNLKQKTEKAIIHYYDIGDYHSREKKLEIVREFASVRNIEWTVLSPDKHNDWLNLRNDTFSLFIPIEPDNKFNLSSKSFFIINSRGIETTRDEWVYNSSKDVLIKNMKNHVTFYNDQVNKLKNIIKTNPKIDIDDFRDNSPNKISWSSSLIDNLKRLNHAKFEKDKIFKALYRPYFKQNIYTGDKMIHRRGQFEQFFPNNEIENYLICVSCVGTNKELSVLITEKISDLHFIGDTQCFPLYWYEKKEKAQKNLFEYSDDDYIRHDAISDFILDQAKTRYGGKVTKEDIFYYVYGILHSPEYRKTFTNDLKKMLPRLPLLEKPADFWTFSKTGRELADLHLNYEDQPPPKEILINGKPIPNKPFPSDQLIVKQMKFPAKDKKDTIIFNQYISISNIPPKAYKYVVNGKSAIEWVMERYSVIIHKESGIENNPNDWAKEHENPQYILDLLLSVITVSMNTVDIVAGLPKVEWE
jgi:predicted helicase